MTNPDTPAQTDSPTSGTDKKKFKHMRESANSADMTDSPALNNDAETPEGGAGEQKLPNGNRYS